MADAYTTIHDFLASHRADEDGFLAELVRVPSDNPPGDCAPHAARAAQLLADAAPDRGIEFDGATGRVVLDADSRQFIRTPVLMQFRAGQKVPVGPR